MSAPILELKTLSEASTETKQSLPPTISTPAEHASCKSPVADLPLGCSHGEFNGERVVWVDFPPGSPDDPYFFPKRSKMLIVLCSMVYTTFCSCTASGFAISVESMCEELGCTARQAQAGIALYAWGAGLMPLFVAPISEEFGRRPTYLAALLVFWVFHVVNAVAKNTATALVARFMAGAAGTIGTSVVGGTLADIFAPADRGAPMALSGFILYLSTGLGGTLFAYVDTRLGWRWVWWFHVIGLGLCAPLILWTMRETRSAIILRRRARSLRAEADDVSLRYLSREEVHKPSFFTALKVSLTRPLIFLFTEPIVLFFSLWVTLAWSVFYVIIAGLPYMMRTIYGFNTEQMGLTYLATCVGALVGLVGFKFQEGIYKKRVSARGVEARLYAPMVAGVLFFLGCYIVGFTAIPGLHWIGSAVGQAVIIAAAMTIYVTAFTYVSECYGTYASSAIASQSSLRNLVGGSVAMVTTDMFRRMTVRWAVVMMGSFAAVLALVPFVAFHFGPRIRARSKYSRLLMELDQKHIESGK